MDGTTKILFTDTNGFLQVKDLKDLPWADLFPGVRAVDVMVAPRVIEELDKHKTSTNQRRRDRARIALRLIEMASGEPGLALVLKDRPVSVRIVISAARRFDWAAHPNLDPAKPDDQLVAEAISFGNGAAIFSHDTGPRIRARIAGIEAHEPPSEWLLPIEQTDDQRRITKLERDLERALSQWPNIVAKFNDLDESTSEIRVISPVLQPLDPDVVDRLAQAYLSKHPRASLGPASNRMALQLGGISEHEIEDYNKKYSSFESEVRAHYGGLHEVVQRVGAVAAIDYQVKNDSGVAAEGLRIEFDLEGNGSLLADRQDAIIGHNDVFELPEPPSPPSRLGYFGSHPWPSLQDHLEPRDPVAFYWFARPKMGSSHSALQCAEFRATREFTDSIFVMAFDALPAEFDLHLHVEATNLRAPVKMSAKILIKEQAVEWSDPLVQAIVPIYLGKLL
jgi:hypothetical protein